MNIEIEEIEKMEEFREVERNQVGSGERYMVKQKVDGAAVR